MNEERKLTNYSTVLANKKEKGVMAIASILVPIMAFVAGTKVASLPNKSVKEDTSISQGALDNDSETETLTLGEDFDINNKEEVNKRAQAIYDLSEKQISVEEIANIIYLINEKQENITLPGSDDVKNYEYIQSLIVDTHKLLDDYVAGYSDSKTELLEGDKESVSVEHKELIQSYMFMSETNTGKTMAKQMASLVFEQTKNIENKDTSKMKEISKSYYEQYEKLLNEKNISNGYNFVIYTDVPTKVSLMNVELTKEQKDILDNNDASKFGNRIAFDAIIKLGIDDEEVIQNAKALPMTPKGKSYGDKANAPRDNKTAPGKGTTEKGGEHIGTQSQVQNNTVTTKVHTDSYVTPVPGNGHYEETVTGGQVVEEKTEVSGGNIIGTTWNYKDEDYVIEEDTTKVYTEEEFNGKKEETTTQKVTTTNRVESTTMVEEDVEDIPIYTDDEFNSLTKLASLTAVGGALAAVGSSLMKKKRRK